MANQGAGSTTDLPDATQLAVARTRLAYERTLMAWVRTATSLISFGFDIYKFFQFLREDDVGNMSHADHLLGPRQFALLMILVGLGTLSMAALQHRQHMQRLRAQGAPIPYSLAMVLALAMVCVVLLFSGSLLVFTGKLFHAKWRGTFAYGALATGVGGQFERRWFTRPESIDESVLAAPDFSATTYLYQVVANVYDMGVIPLDLRNILLLIVATLLPFVPVAFMAIPLDAILAQVAELLL